MRRIVEIFILLALALAGMSSSAMPLGARTLLHGHAVARQLAEVEPTPQIWTVAFDANGGVGGVTNEQDYASKIVAPEVSREGYTFAGWQPAVLEVVPSSNVTYTAQWRINQYEVAFDANGGVGSVTNEQEFASEIVTPVVTREGYTFVKWESDVSPTVPASNVTYTAQWILNEYAITLNLNGGEGKETVAAKHGSVVGDIPIPTKALNEFAGWFTAAEAGERIDATTIITGAMELFAHWSRTHYAVSFDANGGSLAAEDTTAIVEVGGALGERALPVPTKDGQLFVGWFTAEDGNEKIDVNVTITDDVTYYAHWILNTTILVDVGESYMTEDDGSFVLSLSELVFSASTPKLAVKGLPSGLKYDAKTGTISGKATKPGVYTVTVSATNATVKKPVTATFEIVVPNLSCDALASLEPERDAYGVVMCGVAFDPELVDCTSKDGWTVKVAGLPAGLKFTTKPVTSKSGTGKTAVVVTNVPANTIYGVPTKAGTYTVTFTATKGKEKQVATITLNVETLPDWAVGTFTGYVAGTRDACPYQGFATMTVAANGKVSGKIALDNTNWAFSAASYAVVECPSSDVDEASFIVEADAKAGKTTMPVKLAVRSTSGPYQGTTLLNGTVDGTFGEGEVQMWRNVWKDKATAAAAKAEIAKWEGVYTISVEDGGYLSLTVGKDGTVKASGKLSDGTVVSASAPLMYHVSQDYFTMLCAAPSAYKGGHVWLPVGFGTARGQLGTLGESLSVCSRNPQASGEYGAGFTRQLGFTGAYYNKTKTLNDYYGALSFEATSPTLNGNPPTNDDAVDVTFDGKGKPVIPKNSGLSLSFTQATGIFKGSYTFIFDAKTKKKVSFEGIMVQDEDLDKLVGFYLWDATGEYVDPKTGKPKTYKYKESYPVTLQD